MSDQFDICFVHDVDPDKLQKFLSDAFNPEKASFLMQHGDWWHRNSPARFVLREKMTGNIVGYSSLIQSQVLIGNQSHTIYWLIDVYILSAYRGRGLQRLLDQAVKQIGHIQLGFPNELASKIHKKHGWGVRTDGERWQYLFSLRALNTIRYRAGLFGKLLRGMAQIIDPIFAFYQHQRLSSDLPLVEIVEIQDPDPDELSSVFADYLPREAVITSQRNADYIKWRYLQAPYRDELRFFIAKDNGQTILAMVTRTMMLKGLYTMRILDLWGDLEHHAGMSACLARAQDEAFRAGVKQLLLVVTDSQLRSIVKQHNFIEAHELAFCWLSEDTAIMDKIASMKSHWVFADSDLDYSH